MIQVKTYNKISPVGLNVLDKTKYTVSDSFADYDAILVRSANLKEEPFSKDLKCIARAGAGVNNIPLDKCAEQGIVVFNTPGANANAVKELVICGLLLSSRKIVQGAAWVKTLSGDDLGKQAEKGKSNYAGPEISGKKLGVVGLGAIGRKVAAAAAALGMDIIGYDPFMNDQLAKELPANTLVVDDLDKLFAGSDYITLHVPQNKDTEKMINEQSIAKMKDGVRILNFARGGLVDDAALAAAMEQGKVAAYATDFASETLMAQENAVCLPHLGASTPESEENCAKMAAEEIVGYLENGNIVNSVNYPGLFVTRTGASRICVLAKNVPELGDQIKDALAKAGIEAEVTDRAKGDYAYAVADTAEAVTEEQAAVVKALDGVIAIRVI